MGCFSWFTSRQLLNAPPLKPTASDLLQDARNKALMADIKRREEMVRRAEASKEADRIREENAHRMWLLAREIREKARETMIRKARLECLERRCLSREDGSKDAMPRTYIEDDELVVRNGSRRRVMGAGAM